MLQRKGLTVQRAWQKLLVAATHLVGVIGNKVIAADENCSLLGPGVWRKLPILQPPQQVDCCVTCDSSPILGPALTETVWL